MTTDPLREASAAVRLREAALVAGESYRNGWEDGYRAALAAAGPTEGPDDGLAARLVHARESQCSVLYPHPEHVVTSAVGTVGAYLMLCPGLLTVADEGGA